MQDRDDNKKQKLIDLLKEISQPLSPQPPLPTPGSPWAQGNHNIVIGGNLSIHLPASAGPLYKEGSYE